MDKENKYDFRLIEPKWQKRWEEAGLYRAVDPPAGGPKKYFLVEFPYPSGAGLHVGHIRSWAAMDAFSRKARMQGYNVLFPMGWDAFGLPAENYAIKMGLHPSKTVKENIIRFKKQCQQIGLSFDWTREIDTTDPKYYRWTQWIFLQLFKKGLAYQKEVSVNWCPACKTNLADEEVLSGGIHERCGKLTEKRMQKQWLFKITAYADRLLEDLKKVDYSPQIAQQQINWIGKTEGITIDYPVVGKNLTVSCYSTRPDTNFGATFVVIAPEHPMVEELTIEENKKTVEQYIKDSKKKSEIERMDLTKEKTGVFTGSRCLNRLTNKEMPIWVSDFVVLTAGTGIVVGVPAHDGRDWQFAQKYDLEIIPVVKPKDKEWDYQKSPFTEIDEAEIFNSDFLNGLPAQEAKEKIIDYLVEKRWGKRAVNYHMRDWIFSRQHYWGEPIPIVHCQKCGLVPVSEKELPVELPYVEKYQPAGTGESPLAAITKWVNTICPNCGGPGKRETDTMPNWAGSNWYFLRFLDPSNDKMIADHKKIKYWMPIDVYQGGFEHTTLHLLYSRFIYKFLYDIKVVPTVEPYLKRRSHGIVLGSGSRKMSKSFGNVVGPDEIITAFGADSLRLYEAFIGPFEQMVTWSQEGLEGCFRFLKRVWNLVTGSADGETPADLSRKLHQTIKKVGEDIEAMKFNTAVAAMMEFINAWQETGSLSKKDTNTFLQILAPFAPYITEELWEKLGNKFSIHQSAWPKYDPSLIAEETVTIAIQVNGKLRGTINVQFSMANDQLKVEKLARKSGRIKKYLEGNKIKKIIFVPGKLINFVV